MATVIRDARLDGDPLLLARVRAQEVEAHGVGELDEQRDESPSAEDELTAALEALQAKTDAAVDAGYKQGYEEGLRQGKEDGEKQFLEAEAQRTAEQEGYIAALGTLLESAETALARAIDESEDILVEIAFEGLCQILGETLAQQAGVMAVIAQVVQRARERERLVVRVSPEDMAMIEAHRHQLQSVTQASNIELTADTRVTLGGCFVETTGGTLDGRLETQLQALREVLLNTRNGAEP